jgi:hypothetical protein
VNAYPNVAPAELYDPVSGTFASAASYVGRGGCDFCAPSVLLADGTALFPGQYPAQLYDPPSDVFSQIGTMIHDQSTAAVLLNGQVLFAGGEPIGRLPTPSSITRRRVRLSPPEAWPRARVAHAHCAS